MMRGDRKARGANKRMPFAHCLLLGNLGEGVNAAEPNNEPYPGPGNQLSKDHVGSLYGIRSRR
jgi:hypothetical protein